MGRGLGGAPETCIDLLLLEKDKRADPDTPGPDFFCAPGSGTMGRAQQQSTGGMAKPTENNNIDWPALFFDEEANWPRRLMARAHSRFGQGPDAEAAYNHALDGVSANDWERLAGGYTGKGTPQGFLAVTFMNLLEEYAVRKYGRRRPPVWLQRLGTMWKQVYEMLCLKRMEPETIVESLTARDAQSPAEVRTAITQVRGRIPGCGEFFGEATAEEESGVGDPVEHSTPTAELEGSELSVLLRVLGELLGPGEQSLGDVAAEQAAELRQRMELSNPERLLLKLVYQEGQSVTNAGRSLKMHERKARRMHHAVMARLSAVLGPYLARTDVA